MNLILLLAYSLLTAGQMQRADSIVDKGRLLPVLNEVVLQKMNILHDTNIKSLDIEWFGNKESLNKFEIRHDPQNDFNIYLTFNYLATPGVKTSMEVSLNYTGQMNVRNLIALRRKEK